MQQEKWVDIKGYEGIYFISDSGRVKSMHRKTALIMRQTLEGCGYLQVQLRVNGKLKHHKIHRLIASAFIDNPSGKPFVNHKNGIKTDNRIENLEWCTASENILHAFRNNLKKPSQLGKSGRLHHASKPVISINMTAIVEHESVNLCAKYFGVTDRAIHGALKDGFVCKGNQIYYA